MDTMLLVQNDNNMKKSINKKCALKTKRLENIATSRATYCARKASLGLSPNISGSLRWVLITFSVIQAIA